MEVSGKTIYPADFFSFKIIFWEKNYFVALNIVLMGKMHLKRLPIWRVVHYGIGVVEDHLFVCRQVKFVDKPLTRRKLGGKEGNHCRCKTEKEHVAGNKKQHCADECASFQGRPFYDAGTAVVG